MSKRRLLGLVGGPRGLPFEALIYARPGVALAPACQSEAMRWEELLALTWADIDLEAGVIHVRAQLSRARRGVPAWRVAPKTRGGDPRHPALAPARRGAPRAAGA